MIVAIVVPIATIVVISVGVNIFLYCVYRKRYREFLQRRDMELKDVPMTRIQDDEEDETRGPLVSS
jgi:hypothetical protein